MAQEKGHGIGNTVSNIFKFLFEGGINTVKEKVHQAQKRLMYGLYAGLMMLTGIIFVAIALAQMLPDLLSISRGMSFLITGLILIIIAFIIKSNTK